MMTQTNKKEHILGRNIAAIGWMVEKLAWQLPRPLGSTQLALEFSLTLFTPLKNQACPKVFLTLAIVVYKPHAEKHSF